MVTYFDTSLLFSLYVPQATSTVNVPELIPKVENLQLTELGYNELCNAIRLCCFRGEIQPSQALKAINALKDDIENVYHWVSVDWNVAFQNSYEIGEAVTQQTGIRFMDLMHLSVAKSVGVTDFYSADKRQCMAAHLVDFKVHDYSNAK